MATTAEGAGSNVGIDRFALSPAPSWLLALLPQVYIAPPALTAMLWLAPAAIRPTPEARPLTATGVGRLAVVPSPSWPKALKPHATMLPSLLIASECASPAAIATTF